MVTTTPTTKTVDAIVADWPDSGPGNQLPRETAEKMREKYGEPDEATPNRLVWHDNGPWKRTEVHRNGPEHRFPVPHVDHLYQFVDYQVPPEKHDDLARFDGSLLLRRTEGEMGVTCHREEANILGLNLAHDVVDGDRTVEEAREDYAAINAKLMAGGSPAYTQRFQFPLPSDDQRDPDVTILTEELKRRRRGLAVAGLALVGLLFVLARRRGGQQEQSGSGRADEPTEGIETSGEAKGRFPGLT
ncbi:hypothetical protein HALDL1_11900 [Halobacterium sp. DL1]|jgi:hypothetical protein|nr:hypothetical protein HALDL1_11900 [Halobacterium sp. DL1]